MIGRMASCFIAGLAGLAMLLASEAVHAQNLTVLAAASLKEALDNVSAQFQRTGGGKVAVAYAASSALAKQIENGAPADVFFSADLDWMDYVDQRKLLRAGTRVNLLRNRLALIAPFGLFDETDPAADPWAQRKDAVAKLMCADGARWEAMVSPPEGANSVEWPIEMTRAAEAAARAFWPLGNTRLEKRLGLIVAPTLVLWGEKDAIQPPSYAAKFAKGIGSATKVQSIPGAGHLAYLDQPEAVARAVLAHLA